VVDKFWYGHVEISLDSYHEMNGHRILGVKIEKYTLDIHYTHKI
jgi:hypothetical protein